MDEGNSISTKLTDIQFMYNQEFKRMKEIAKINIEKIKNAIILLGLGNDKTQYTLTKNKRELENAIHCSVDGIEVAEEVIDFIKAHYKICKDLIKKIL